MTAIYQRVLCISVLFLCFSSLSKAQEKEKEKLFTASLSYGTNLSLYSFQTDQLNFQERSTPFDYRFFVNGNLKASKFSIPFSLAYTKNNLTANYPSLPDQQPIDYILDPRNNVGIHPTWDWGTIHVGTHKADFSELTTGNIPIFGLGYDINPGKFRFAASYGFTNTPIETNNPYNILPEYRRRLMGAKIGLGNKDKSNVHLNFVKISDVESSIVNDFSQVTPNDNLIVSIDNNFKFSEAITWKNEVAAAAITNHTLYTSEGDGGTYIEFLPGALLKANETTKTDYSYLSRLSFDYEKFGIAAEVKRLGAGYRTLAFPYMKTDFIDITVSPRFSLAKGKINWTNTFGYRFDNLENTKGTRTNTKLINTNLSINATKVWNINAGYSNFGQENNELNDTLRVNYISSSLNLNTTYRIKKNDWTSQILAGFTKSKFEDLNLFTGVVSDNDAQVIILGVNNKLRSLKTGLNYVNTKNNQSLGKILIHTVTARAGYSLGEKKWDLSTAIAFSNIRMFNFTSDVQWRIKPKVRWKPTKKINLDLAGTFRMLQYGDRKNNNYLNEQIVQLNFSHRL